MSAPNVVELRPEPASPAPLRRLLTTEQLAEILQVSTHAVHQMSARGELPPAIKIGRRVRYDERDVDEWLDGMKEQ